MLARECRFDRLRVVLDLAMLAREPLRERDDECSLVAGSGAAGDRGEQRVFLLGMVPDHRLVEEGDDLVRAFAQRAALGTALRELRRQFAQLLEPDQDARVTARKVAQRIGGIRSGLVLLGHRHSPRGAPPASGATGAGRSSRG